MPTILFFVGISCRDTLVSFYSLVGVYRLSSLFTTDGQPISGLDISKYKYISHDSTDLPYVVSRVNDAQAHDQVLLLPRV